MALDTFDSSESMVEKYGEEACVEADKLNEAAVASSTLDTYKPHVRSVVSELGPLPSPQDVIDHIPELEKAPSTKNTMIAAVKKYYKACDRFDNAEKLGELAEMEDFSSDEFNSSMKVEEWITEDEVFRILDNMCPAEGESASIIQAGDSAFRSTKEHEALVGSLYFTGLRVSECLLIEVNHIDFEEQEMVVFRKKKGGDNLKRDKIRITDRYIDILHDYMNTMDIQDGLLFDFTTRTAQNRINEINEAYKTIYGEFEHCPKLKPHTFRHGRVTAIARASDLEAAGDFVDHSSIDTTMAYKHTTTEDQEGILPEDEREEESDDLEEVLEEVGAESVDELKELID